VTVPPALPSPIHLIVNSQKKKKKGSQQLGKILMKKKNYYISIRHLFGALNYLPLPSTPE
jgi:hypothetical protein